MRKLEIADRRGTRKIYFDIIRPGVSRILATINSRRRVHFASALRSGINRRTKRRGIIAALRVALFPRHFSLSFARRSLSLRVPCGLQFSATLSRRAPLSEHPRRNKTACRAFVPTIAPDGMRNESAGLRISDNSLNLAIRGVRKRAARR